MLTVAVSFANFGPYHLARLRALAARLRGAGGRLVAYETAGTQGLYPWVTARASEPFDWVTLFPDRVLEDLSSADCAGAMARALDRDPPDAVLTSGYARPECVAMLRWAGSARVPAVLMSESQAIDHPRAWWKEAIKSRRVRRYASALVGGARHRDYLIGLGMPADRIAMGYNAVDGEAFATAADRFRDDPAARGGLPARPYFLAVSRFAPEKNLPRLVDAFARYRASADPATAWDLVLCGGGPDEPAVARAVEASGVADAIRRPGFLQSGGLSRCYAFASAFVHPSLLEPWGLVVNEAAACGLPLVVSDRCGCVETFVPEVPGQGGPVTGLRIDGRDPEGMATALATIAGLPEPARRRLGANAARIAAAWGPPRFGAGAMEAIEIGLARGPVSRGRALAGIV